MKTLRIITALTVIVGLVLTTVISCGSSRPSSQMDARQLFEAGKEKYEKEKYLSAIEFFQTIVFNYPGNSIVDTAQYYLGLSYFSNDEYELAAVEFNRLALNYPSSAYFENAVFMRAVSYYEATPDNSGLDQTDLERALNLLEDFLIDFPESQLIPDAQKYLAAARGRLARKLYDSGVVYDRVSAPKAAKIYFQQVVDDYTDTEWGAKATFQLALMELRLKEYDEARRRFENFRIVFADHEWVTQAAEKEAEAAFLGCEQKYKQGDFAEAKQCLVEFMADFPESDRIKKAGQLVAEIDALPPVAGQQEEHGGS